MNTLTKALLLSSLVMLLSACATNRYGGYSNNDYSSGYNYPSSGYGGYNPQPSYPYGNYRNNPYNNQYSNYPTNPGYGGYGRPYYGGNPNNNYYNNRIQPRPIPAPPGFYRNQKPTVVEDRHHEQNNYYYGRPPYNQGRWQGNPRPQPAPPPAARNYNNWQGQQPQRNYGNQPNWGNNHGNWQRPQGNNFNHQAGGGGQWQNQNRPQQPVVRIQNNGGNVNFGRMTERMGQQPVNPGQNHPNWEHNKHRHHND
jgi:hypothetical protein